MAPDARDFEAVTLRLVPVKHWPTDPAYRLKVLLKRLLRSYGFRCVQLEASEQLRRESERRKGA
jgi:hypothetical protein